MPEISMRESYGRALADYGAKNSKVVAVDVDTSCSTLSNFFQSRYPERFYNVGIAEPCMVDVAAGLALGGLIPFINGFASLLSLRALEQIRTNLCYAHTNVKVAASYAGLSDYKDGPTHYSVSDIAIMRSLPGMTVIVPADAVEAAAWVPVIAEFDGPVYFRISRAACLSVHSSLPELKIGKGITLRNGNDLSILTTGSMTGRSLQAADKLLENGIHVRVIELPTIKPLDTELVFRAAEETGILVTAEEHSMIGGLGGAVAEYLTSILPVPIHRIGIPDNFCPTGPDPDTLMDAMGLSVQQIVKTVEDALRQKTSSRSKK
jgi:transketolase